MTILDSNVWIGFFYPHDSQHIKARKTFEQVQLPLLLPEYIVSEVCTVLTRQAGKTVANQFVEEIADNVDIRVTLTEPFFFRDLLEFYRANPHKGLSFTDISLLLLSRDHTVITFDRKLEQSIKKLRRLPRP